MKKLGYVDSLLTGKAKAFSRGADSAIDKQVVNGAVLATEYGFDTDQQADTRFHGGIDKALHIYPLEHYQCWRDELGNKAIFQQAGAFGENLSSVGITEHTVCINDIFRIGSVLVQVSQGRQPCWKLNDRCQQPDMALRLQMSLRTGWYFRVLEQGFIEAGDEIMLVERGYPEWSVAKIMQLIYQGCLASAKLAPLLELPLGKSWHQLIRNRLEHGAVENWSPRIFGSMTAG